MNCFEHPQKPAVGTCTHCGRGLCKECTTVVEGKLSCRGTCQTEVARVRQLLTDSERANSERSVVYGTSARIYHQAFAATTFFGLLFVIVGAALLFTEIAIGGAILIAFGVVLGIRGAGFARAGKKFKSLADTRTEAQPVAKQSN
jgi:hypothetical protein